MMRDGTCVYAFGVAGSKVDVSIFVGARHGGLIDMRQRASRVSLG
jgi:hypothetical protein